MHKRAEALLIFSLTLPLLSQGAPASLPPAATAAQDRLIEANHRRDQCLRYLRAYHFAENARQSFLKAVASKPNYKNYNECFQCIADQFTNENIEPKFREVIFLYMNLDQLTKLNDLLESDLGRKLIKVAELGGGEDNLNRILTTQDRENYQKLRSEEFYKAAANFNTYGLPRVSGGDVARAYLVEFRQKCSQYPHPW